MGTSISLEDQIKVQREYMWSSVLWACLILVLGIATTIYFFLASNSVGLKIPEFMKVGPLFVSSAITAFPWKICMECRARVATYRTLQKNFTCLDEKSQAEILSQVLAEALKQTVKIG